MSQPIRTVVVGIGAAHGVDGVLAHAGALLRETDAEIHLVHAAPWSPFLEGEVVIPDTRAATYAAIARELRDGGRQAFGREVACHVVDEEPAAALLRIARERGADLVVVGGGVRRGYAGPLWGSVAQRVARDADRPVLLLRGDAPREWQRALFTGDLSPLSRSVHEAGVRILGGLTPAEVEARSLLVLSWALPPHPLSPEAIQRAGDAELRDFLASVPSPVPIAPVVRVGEPASEILAEAEAWLPDVVVLGTHGRSLLPRILLGSVAEGVLRRADVNVLVVPARAVAGPQEVAVGASTRVVAMT